MHRNHSPYTHSPAKIPPSPRLLRSKSGNIATSPPKTRPNTSNSCSSSKRISKTNEKDKEKVTPKYHLVKKDNANYDNHLHASRNAINNTDNVRRRIRSAPTSPSAWALSPGRSNLPFANLVPSSSSIIYSKTKNDHLSTSGVGRRSGDRILSFFGLKKKVSREQEEEFHRFRIMQNRLLQWRFVNDRVEKSTRAVKKVAETKLFSAWLRLYVMRNSILEKRLQVQKLVDEIKLYQIIVPQMCLLIEWTKLDYKNTEAVGRLNRKLSSMSIRLPLVQGAKGDVASVHDALKGAVEAMDNMQAIASNFLPQVERICFLVTELALLKNQQEECLNELESWVSTIVPLQVKCIPYQLVSLQLSHEFVKSCSRALKLQPNKADALYSRSQAKLEYLYLLQEQEGYLRAHLLQSAT